MVKNSRVVKKPTISSSFYDSYTNKPVKWYEIVDSFRQTTETYLPLRLENYPRELWDNFKNFFKSDEKVEEVDDDDPVNEEERTRSDGNIIKVTEYDLSKGKFNPKISDAVRTHSDAIPALSRQTFHKSGTESRQPFTPSPSSEKKRHHRHTSRRRSPVNYDDCPECRALAAQGYPTMCQCAECQANRAAYPTRPTNCNCAECRLNGRY